MKVSPSLASGDVLYVAREVDYIDKYFDNIHLDIEDGVVLLGITFGMKMAKKVCEYSKSREKTIHLEVLNPLDYLEELKQIRCDCVFIQVSHLNNAVEIIHKFKDAGIPTGVNLNDADIERQDLAEIISTSRDFLISTTDPFDPKQEYLPGMEEFALKLAENEKYRVWIDGCVTYETYQRIKDSKLYCAVVGRAIFSDRRLAIDRFSSIMK
ncbi:MAG: hypothetical protein IJI77_00350 [Erysipelotrichaceae bacterium]|nr:hypothetical protein [Erysipelotrichaceae bacterium]